HQAFLQGNAGARIAAERDRSPGSRAEGIAREDGRSRLLQAAARHPARRPGAPRRDRSAANGKTRALASARVEDEGGLATLLAKLALVLVQLLRVFAQLLLVAAELGLALVEIPACNRLAFLVVPPLGVAHLVAVL